MKEFFHAIGHFFDQLNASSSEEAHDINHLFNQFLVLSLVIFAIVCFMTIVGAVKYHSSRRKGEPRQTFGNTKLEITWTVLPLIAVTVFFFLTLSVMKKTNRSFPEDQIPDVVIVAHQFWWDMRYPKYHVVTANELHIPVGKKLLMRVESADVIHSWWVPDLGRKIDAIPGRTNHIWINAAVAGEYEGACSEYCGAEHAWMRIKVVAESEEDFNKWIVRQQKVPQTPADSLSGMGARMFQKMTCANCHTIAGTPAESRIGPDLTHIGSRQTILSGMLPNNYENMKRWLTNPQKVKPGANMPNFMFTDKEIEALSTYLEDLK